MKAIGHGLTGSVCMVLLIGLLATTSYPQEAPAPYLLSRGVQLRANQLNIWRLVVQDPDHPMPYFDTLTAADIVATERARTRGSAALNVEDYDVGFGSECVPVPFKPHTQFLTNNSVRLRAALSGIYVNRHKQEAFLKSINPMVLRLSAKELFDILRRLTDAQGYDRRVINVGGFQ